MKPYTKLDPELYQKVLRAVKCPDCQEIFETVLPGPMCPLCHVYCLTILKPIIHDLAK